MQPPEMLIAVYKECDKGKDKYARFHVNWHDNTAQFLLEPTSSTPSEGHILWDHVSTSALCESRNAVVIASVWNMTTFGKCCNMQCDNNVELRLQQAPRIQCQTLNQMKPTDLEVVP